MSIDAHIYIKTIGFPSEIWDEVIEEFSGLDRGEKRWVIDHQDGPIWLDIIKLHEGHIFAEDYCWKIGIHMKAPYKSLKIWQMLVIPYRCLIFIDDALFFDPFNYRTIDNLEEFEDYAKEYLLRYVSLQKLSKYGLLDEKGSVKL